MLGISIIYLSTGLLISIIEDIYTTTNYNVELDLNELFLILFMWPLYLILTLRAAFKNSKTVFDCVNEIMNDLSSKGIFVVCVGKKTPNNYVSGRLVAELFKIYEFIPRHKIIITNKANFKKDTLGTNQIILLMPQMDGDYSYEKLYGLLKLQTELEVEFDTCGLL